jgi:predicted HicB family RNase H-like nuclease
MGQYLIDFPELTHREAKIRAAQEGITLKELILKAVEEYLRKKETKK